MESHLKYEKHSKNYLNIKNYCYLQLYKADQWSFILGSFLQRFHIISPKTVVSLTKIQPWNYSAFWCNVFPTFSTLLGNTKQPSILIHGVLWVGPCDTRLPLVLIFVLGRRRDTWQWLSMYTTCSLSCLIFTLLSKYYFTILMSQIKLILWRSLSEF